MDSIQKEKLKKVKDWFHNKNITPIKISLFPTYKCNLNCIFCWRNDMSYDSKNEISTAKLKHVIKESKRLGVKEWLISGGGEPLMRKDLSQIMKEIKLNKMRGTLITNGTLIDNNFIKQILKYQWDIIELSIESPDPKTNDLLRGQSKSFERVSRVLDLINNEKKIQKSKKPILIIRSVVNKLNCAQLINLILFSKSKNCEALELNQLSEIVNPAVKFLNIKKDKRFKEVIKNAFEVAKDKSLKLIVNLDYKQNKAKQDKKDKIFCVVPFTEILIRPTGIVSTCCHRKDKLGDLNKESLKSILYNKKFEGLRKKMAHQKQIIACENCNSRNNENYNLLKAVLRWEM